MHVDSSFVNGFHVIKINEDLDLKTDINEFSKMLEDHLKDGIHNIALIFSSNSILYTTALGILAHCFKLLHAKGGVLAIINPNDYIKNVLNIAGFAKMIKICNSVNDLV